MDKQQGLERRSPKSDERGKRRAPNLFLFKKAPNCVSNAENTCKERNTAHSEFVLVDTIYRDKRRNEGTNTEQDREENEIIKQREDKREPNLFLFKKVPNCHHSSSDSCKPRNARNSKFVLVDTVYRDEFKKSSRYKSEKEKNVKNRVNSIQIPEPKDIYDNSENNGETVNYDLDTDTIEQLHFLPFQVLHQNHWREG